MEELVNFPYLFFELLTPIITKHWQYLMLMHVFIGI